MVKWYNYINMLEEKVDLSEKKVIIWGKSISALNLYVQLKTKRIDVIGFTDSFAFIQGEFAGLPVYPYKQVIKMQNIVIYIATVVPKNQIDILDLLQDSDVTVLCRGSVYGSGQYDIYEMDEKINKNINIIQQIREVLSDKKSVETFDNLIKYRTSNDKRLLEEIYEKEHRQYFPKSNIFKPSLEETFIDAGGCNGATSVEFVQWVNGKYNKIYLMEPDTLMQSVAKEYVALKDVQNIIFVGKAAYSKSTIINFENNAESGSSHIEMNGKTQVETVTIDEMLNHTIATYIKMDIEGAELQALQGAKETIECYRPKLAISIYHKDDDLWQIPYYIHENYPWYKLFIRHYTWITTETVLYAVE